MSNSLLNYKGYLNPKQLLPRETIMYHMASVFISMLFFLFLFFNAVEPVISIACSGALNFAIYLFLFWLNNKLCARDNEIIEKYLIATKMDGIDLVASFYNEIRLRFEASKKAYFGSSTSEEIIGVDLLPTFLRIFREDGEDLYNRFILISGNFQLFIQSLSLRQREVLYRYNLSLAL